MIYPLFFWSLLFTIGEIWLTDNLFYYHKRSPRGICIVLGVFFSLTIIPHGWAGEAASPRYVEQYSHFDRVSVPEYSQWVLMAKANIDNSSRLVAKRKLNSKKLIHKKCTRCHGLDRLRLYKNNDWEQIIERMTGFGLEITYEEARKIILHLKNKRPF